MSEPEEKSSLDVTPEQALEEALDRVRTKRAPDKLLVLMLWDENGRYDVGYHNAGMAMSEMITLCEVHKAQCLKDMFSDHSPDCPHSEDT
jgi:hypothetical protein